MTSEPAPAAVAATIAQQLGETEAAAWRHIHLVVQILGSAVTQELVDEAQAIDAGDGMLLPDGSRRRTLGGVFFVLAKQRLPHRDRKRIFYIDRTRAPQTAKGDTPTTPTTPPFVWEQRRSVLEQITQKGQARTVRVTLIGRPGKVIEQGDCIVTVMHNDQAPSLPKGLPTPPNTPTSYGVYIARKQWRGVAEAITNTEDVLIVEGWATYDSVLKGIAVFATNVTTKKLQQAKRQAQQGQS